MERGAFVVQEASGAQVVEEVEEQFAGNNEPSSEQARDPATQLVLQRPQALALFPLNLWKQLRKTYSMRFARLPVDHPEYEEAGAVEFSFFNSQEEQNENCGLYSWDYRTENEHGEMVFDLTEPFDWSAFTANGQPPPIARFPQFYFERPDYANRNGQNPPN